MQNREKHHVIPISIGGHDTIENIVYLTHDQHQGKPHSVHTILNINYSNIRSFRKHTNHVLFADESYIYELMGIQKLYFSKIHLLEQDILKMHRISVERQFFRLAEIYQIKMNVEDYRQRSEEAKFKYFLHMYHSVLLEHVKRMRR